jgi:hypothetical protein
LYAVWQPRNGAGTAAPTNPDDGILIDETYVNVAIADPLRQNVGARAFPEAGGGQGVEHIGNSVLQYLPVLNGGNALIPTATQSVVLEGDIFDTLGSGNKRMSIGLRNRASTVNLLELGQWNAINAGETDTSRAAIGYAYRVQLFPSSTANPNPNWKFFDLPPELDRTTDTDTIVGVGDIGEAWHRYKATITPTQVTIEFDLYRDGLRNTERTAGVGTPGVDGTASFTFASPLTTGFDSLRLGGASGLASAGAGGVVFDNIKLSLVDVGTPVNSGDFNGDGRVDGGDLSLLLANWGSTVPPNPSGWTGDLPTATGIDADELSRLLANWGFGTSTAIPEPSAAILAMLAGFGMARRRR